MKLSKVNNGNLFFALIFCCLIILEICFNVYFNKGTLEQTANSFGLFAVSIATGIYVITRFYKKDTVLMEGSGNSLYRKLNPVLWTVGMLILSFVLNGLWKKYPIAAGTSDIIPTLEVAADRFLNGEMPYKTISKWGYDLPLTYLPFQWGPYMISYLLKFDYRWIAVALNFIGGFWIIRRSSKLNQPVTMVVPLLLILNWTLIIINNDGILANTIETMIAGYYMMLIMGLAGKNPWLKGLVIACCLLSRYSLVLWLPLWLFIELVSGDKRQLMLAIAVTTGVVLVTYILPFLSRDPQIFLNGYKYYTVAAIGEWNHLNEHQQPYHLYSGSGFAYLFYERLNSYTIPDRIKSLQKVHMLACLSSVFVLGIWYWYNRKRIHQKVFLLGSFKIYLSVFLVFIQVPYNYLMITGSFVSIAILAELLRYQISKPITESR